MILKGTKLYSIITFKCPVCHSGNFYDGFLLKANVSKECSHCKTKLEKEPAFYQGSYYVTYALGVAQIIMLSSAYYVLSDSFNWDTLGIVLLIGLPLMMPINYPLSKIIWANFFFTFQADTKES